MFDKTQAQLKIRQEHFIALQGIIIALKDSNIT